MDKKVALVTGASRGIGKAIAQRLASDGFFVVVNFNGSADAAASVVKEIEENGGEAVTYQCSVADFTAVETMIKDIIKTYGSLDVLVNNAGITKDNLIMRMNEEDFDSVIATNLKGTFNTIKHTARQMLKQKAGAIINIASVSGVLGNAGQANYSASKAGVIGLTKAVARELASRHIRVNAVAPGFVETEMVEKMPEAALEEGKKQIPFGTLAKPEDIAAAVSFFASEQASYITGQVLCVDGGMAM
ncbi:MAG: 3-oxoacyl-[acyl-carrier-protein] reductase [Lachnospiraceae bacterium]